MLMQRCAARIQRSLKYVELTASLIMKLCLLPLEEEIKTDAFCWCVQHLSSPTRSLPPLPLPLFFYFFFFFFFSCSFFSLRLSIPPLTLSVFLRRIFPLALALSHKHRWSHILVEERQGKKKRERESVRCTSNEMHELSFNKGER